MTTLISGKLLASEYENYIKLSLKEISKKVTPGLSMIIVGNNPSSLIYVNNKKRMCNKLNINSHIEHMREEISEKSLLEYIDKLNMNPGIHGILVQMPLPNHIDSKKVLEQILPIKDVDGLHPYNIGRLVSSNPQLIPCTPSGCMQLIHSVTPNISGMNAVVLGRSILVGKPMAALLCENDATVTIIHSKSRNIKKICKMADILVCAVGRPNMITKEYVNPKTIVIDVGITSINKKIQGDVNFNEVSNYVSAITPVPGGVGPMTIMNLMLNTIKACCIQNNISIPIKIQKIMI